MKKATARRVIFHGEYAKRYIPELTIHADSLYGVCTILFESVFPKLMHEKALSIVLEDTSGIMTDLFDPQQELHKTQTKIHIIPNPDGEWIQVVYAIITAIIAVGIAMLLAPKMGALDGSGSGNNFDSVENVIGQGGAMPIVLGTRQAGSRVVSHGIDSTIYSGRSV